MGTFNQLTGWFKQLTAKSSASSAADDFEHDSADMGTGFGLDDSLLNAQGELHWLRRDDTPEAPTA